MVDMLALFSRRTIQDGAHHIPADGLGVKAVVVPDDDALFAFQQLERGLGVFLNAFVVVVAIHEDHVIFAKVWYEVKGLRVTVELLHVGQLFTEEAVQISIEWVASQLDDVLFRQVIRGCLCFMNYNNSYFFIR